MDNTQSEAGTQTGRTLTYEDHQAFALLRFFEPATKEQTYDMLCSVMGMMFCENPPRTVPEVAARISKLTPQVFLNVCDTIDADPTSSDLIRTYSSIFRSMTNITNRMQATPAPAAAPGSIASIVNTLRDIGIDMHVIELDDRSAR